MEVYKARYNYQKAVKRGKGKKFIFLIILALILVLSSGGFTYAAATKNFGQGVITITGSSLSSPETINIDWPNNAQAAFGSDKEGLILASSNEKIQPIASITKIITALTVLEKKPIKLGEDGENFTINSKDEQLFRDYIAKQGAVVPVRSGQILTQYDMLNALLLPSANNIADSLVIKIFGSIDAYVVEANNLIRQYGLTSTVIADASGFSPKTTSTPSDLIVIGNYALKNEVVKEIAAKETYNFPGYGEIKNSNRLLASRDQAIGLKTGTTDEAGYCLLFAETHGEGDNSLVIIGTVLGADSINSLYQSSERLLDSVQKGFKNNIVVASGTEVANQTTVWGQSSPIKTSQDLSYYGWSGLVKNIEYDISLASPQMESNQRIGFVSIGETNKVEVYLANQIEGPSFSWRLQNVF